VAASLRATAIASRGRMSDGHSRSKIGKTCSAHHAEKWCESLLSQPVY
jgi:hypothetical protein